MTTVLQNVTHTCFGLSYLLAFALELARLRWPTSTIRIGAIVLGAIGLFTHSLFLAANHPTPATAYGALLAVAWVLAVFYLYGSLHYRRYAWAIFVLPLVLGLVAISFTLVSDPVASNGFAVPPWATGNRFWGAVHGILLLLAAVGVSVGSVASVMYLIQARRLRKKLNPLGGMHLLSLERLENMNRRAVNRSFPLLTAGLLLGGVLLKQYHDLSDWLSLKVLATFALWLAFLVLLYLRYAAHVPGRRLAACTLVVFALMMLVLLASHPFAESSTKAAAFQEVSQ